MKAWWIYTGWPWLKSNYWVLLLLPVMAIVAIGMFMMRMMPPKTKVIDPTAEADERARIEAETRGKAMSAEQGRLAQELEAVSAERDSLRAVLEAKQRNEVDGLRKDPEALREAMLRAGRGQ